MNPPDPTHVIAASNAAPNLDPQSIVAASLVAQSPAGAVGNATATANYGETMTQAQHLSTLTPQDQQTVWHSMTQTEQQQLNSVGWSPAQVPGSAPRGLFSGLVHDVTHYAGDVTGAVTHVAGDVIGGVESGLRGLQHLERTAVVVGEIGQAAGGETPEQVVAQAKAGWMGQASGQSAPNIGASLKSIFTLHSWSQAYRETNNGEKSFDPAIERQIQSTADPTKFNIAKQMASIPAGQDPSQMEISIVNSYPQAQRQQVTQMIHSDSDLRSMISQLQAAKISIGHAAVGQKYMLDHPLAGKLLSGGIDGALDIASDPALQVGKVAKAAEITNYGIDAARAAQYTASDATAWESLVNHMSDKGTVQRLYSEMADTINTKGYGALDQVKPYLLNAAPSIAKALDGAPATPENLQGFFSSMAGARAILSGQAARASGGAAIFPHLSALGAARMKATGALTGVINFGDDAKKTRAMDKEKLIASDIAGAPHDLLAADATGHLPATLGEIAPTDANQTFAQRMGGHAANLGLGTATKVNRVMKQMTTLTTSMDSIDLGDPSAVVQVKRLLQPYLPSDAVNQITDLFAKTKDEGQKFNIVKGATDQMFHLAGVYHVPNGPEIAKELLKTMDNSYHGETYAPLGLDKIEGVPSAVFDSQLSSHVFLPNFHDLAAIARQQVHLAAVRVPVAQAAEQFMGAWRAGVLARPGFPIRTSIDENLSNALRNGIIPAIVSHVTTRIARRANKIETAAKLVEDGLDPRLGRTARAVQVFSDKVPPEILSKVKTTKDLASAVLGDAAWKATTPFSEGLTRAELHEGAGLVQQHVWDSVSPHISALESAGGGYDKGKELIRISKDGKPDYMRLVPGRTFSDVAASDPFWRQKWQMSLGTMARSKLAQSVLWDIDKTRVTQERNVLKIIQSPEFAETKARMRRGFKMPDGRVVGPRPGLDATQAEVDRAFARTVVSTTHAMVRSGDPKDGPILRGLVGVLRSGDAPTSDLLDSYGQHELPAATYGPDMVAVSSTEHLIQKLFTPLSGMMDHLARQPIFTQAFTQALKEIRPWAEKLAGPGENADELASHLAADRAISKVKPFFHSPEVRSQFEVLHRTALPFLFAQVQFLKRWGKTFATNPDALAKVQLGMNGLRTTGIIHRDANGNDYFTYPGSQYVTDLVARTANAIGIPAWVPLLVPFTGQLKNTMPGLNSPLTPNVGPTVGMPMKAIAQKFPELQGIEQTMLGPGASNSYWEQIAPSALARVIHAVADGPDMPGQFSSAMIKAMQDLQAGGHGLAPNADTKTTEAYMRRLTDWTRNLFFMKAIVGFSAPASPQFLFDPKNLSGRLSTLMKELPYDQALTQFIKENPDATPYTVFASKSTGGASLPASKAAGEFINSNAPFVQAYPQAVGWLIPRETGNAPYDPSVYREQINYGMRDQKLPAQFLDDILTAPASKTYYAAYDKEQAALGNGSIDANGVYTPYVGNKHPVPTAQANAIRSDFDQQKAQFLAQNPTFADQLQSSTTKARREQTIWQLQQALNDPTVPKGPQTVQVKHMLTAFDNYMQQYDSLLGITTTAATKTKRAMQEDFITQGTAYALAHPEVSDMWSNLIRPEVSDTTVGLAQSPAAQQLTQAVAG